MRMRRLRAFVQACRLPAHGIIALPTAVGVASAWRSATSSSWTLYGAALAHTMALAAQCGILAANDVFDAPLDCKTTAYYLSGGSRVIPQGKLTVGELRAFAELMLAAAIVLTTAAALSSASLPGLLFGLAAILIGVDYSAPPVRWSYCGYGEAAQGVAVGIFLPAFAHCVSGGPVASLPIKRMFLLAIVLALGNIATALPDEEADAEFDKLSFVVRHGRKVASRVLYTGFTCILAAHCSEMVYAMNLSAFPASLVAAYALCLALAFNAHSNRRLVLSSCAMCLLSCVLLIL